MPVWREQQCYLMRLHFHFLHFSHILALPFPWHSMHISLISCVIHRSIRHTPALSIRYQLNYIFKLSSITSYQNLNNNSTCNLQYISHFDKHGRKTQCFQCKGQTIKCPVCCCPLLSSILFLFFNANNQECWTRHSIQNPSSFERLCITHVRLSFPF